MPLRRSHSVSNPCSLLRLALIFSSCIMTAMSMSFFALDMRVPKKCVVINYPGTNLEVNYEIFGELIHIILFFVCERISAVGKESKSLTLNDFHEHF